MIAFFRSTISCYFHSTTLSVLSYNRDRDLRNDLIEAGTAVAVLFPLSEQGNEMSLSLFAELE